MDRERKFSGERKAGKGGEIGEEGEGKAGRGRTGGVKRMQEKWGGLKKGQVG